MQVIHERCAALDVHKKTVVMTIMLTQADGSVQQLTRTFLTMTADLLALSDWLEDHNVQVIALESTGVFWRPVFNVLEEGRQVILVNAQHKQSGGKRLSGKTTKGNPYLRAILFEVAWAIAHTKDNYLSAFYHRMARRRGKHKAIAALAHKVLVVIYHILRTKKPYKDLGADYFDQRDRKRIEHHHVHRLEQLGYRNFGLKAPVFPSLTLIQKSWYARRKKQEEAKEELSWIKKPCSMPRNGPSTPLGRQNWETRDVQSA